MNRNRDFAFDAETSNDWGDCAVEYAKISAKMGFYQEITEWLVRLIHPGIQTLVDFGCGDGRLTRTFLQTTRGIGPAPKRVFLIDKFRQMLDLTEDLQAGGTEFVRICDTEALSEFPCEWEGEIGTVGCNSSFFLCRDVNSFVGRVRSLLRVGGSFVGNIPDQDFVFKDGWRSRFKQEADKLWDDPAPNMRERLSHDFLVQLATDNGFHVETHVMTCQLPWDDFVRFYSIPFMGARRMPGTTQEQRVCYLRNLAPRFVEIPYRWALFVMTKRD